MAERNDNATDHDRLHRLADAAKQGDRAAAADLLRALQDTIYRFALSQLGDPDAADEATQETGLRLLKSLPRFERRSRVTTWVLGVALNVCREQRRRRTESIDADRVEQAASNEPTSDQLSERADDHRRLQAELANLPPRQREAVVLRYFEGLSVAETAQAMGCSPGAAKASVWQALRRLRSALSKNETTEEAIR